MFKSIVFVLEILSWVLNCLLSLYRYNYMYFLNLCTQADFEADHDFCFHYITLDFIRERNNKGCSFFKSYYFWTILKYISKFPGVQIKNLLINIINRFILKREWTMYRCVGQPQISSLIWWNTTPPWYESSSCRNHSRMMMWVYTQRQHDK